jgi:hypothetical protein
MPYFAARSGLVSPLLFELPEAVMKKTLIIALAVTLGAAGLAAQQTGQDTGAPLGRGRGGAPYAWNDKNKDGICDLTGQAVGQRQGRGVMGMRGGRGRGFAGSSGRGFGRGMGRAMGSCAGQQTGPAPSAK